MNYGAIAPTQAFEALSDSLNHPHWIDGVAQPYVGRNLIELEGGLGDYAKIWLDRREGRVRLTNSDEEQLIALIRRYRLTLSACVSAFKAALESGATCSRLEPDDTGGRLQRFRGLRDAMNSRLVNHYSRSRVR